MKKWLLSSALISLSISIKAQEMKLLNATQQSWSGGVCCIHGTNSIITIEGSDTTVAISIDTIWLGDKMFTANEPSIFNLTKSISKGKIKIQLYIAERYDDNQHEMLLHRETVSKTKPPKYNGQACVIYQINKQKKVLIIKSFSRLEPLAYP